MSIMTIQQAKAHIKARGYTQRLAAIALGVTEPHLCKVLNGRLDATDEMLAKISALPRAERHPKLQSLGINIVCRLS